MHRLDQLVPRLPALQALPALPLGLHRRIRPPRLVRNHLQQACLRKQASGGLPSQRLDKLRRPDHVVLPARLYFYDVDSLSLPKRLVTEPLLASLPLSAFRLAALAGHPWSVHVQLAAGTIFTLSGFANTVVYAVTRKIVSLLNSASLRSQLMANRSQGHRRHGRSRPPRQLLLGKGWWKSSRKPRKPKRPIVGRHNIRFWFGVRRGGAELGRLHDQLCESRLEGGRVTRGAEANSRPESVVRWSERSGEGVDGGEFTTAKRDRVGTGDGRADGGTRAA